MKNGVFDNVAKKPNKNYTHIHEEKNGYWGNTYSPPIIDCVKPSSKSVAPFIPVAIFHESFQLFYFILTFEWF